ncbi:MAG TPA: S1C family serine protease, partial [Pyrinomonadaceae bacterium]|nr:S1C family serine protease [Pyrinomonadaceae bacterium]
LRKPDKENAATYVVARFRLVCVCRVEGFVLKRNIPRLAVAFFVFTTIQVARAQESLPDLVRRVKPSVVSVQTYDAKGEPLISGSGFFIRPGEVVTNMHVIRGAHRVEIHTLEGKGRTFPVA